MKRSTILKSVLAVAMLVGMNQTGSAQGHYGVAPKFADAWGGTVNNWHKDYVGARLIVTAPSSVAGSKAYTIGNDGTGTSTEWGRAIDSVWQNVQLIKQLDTLGASPATNAAQLSGNWALVFRGGGVEFSHKALMAQQAGAKGVIIVNNIPGGPVGMGGGASAASINIPVLMISKADGDLLNQQLTNGTTVTVSLTKWGFNMANDLGFVPTGAALWHNNAIPFKQLNSSNGNPSAYKGLMGAFIANYGTTDQSSIKVVSTTSFTPTGGSAAQITTDSVLYSSFATADSIHYVFTDNAYDIHPTSTGTYNITYNISQSQTDLNPSDNQLSYSFVTTDSIFTKGAYDFANGKVVAARGNALASGADFSWGGLFYVADGDYLTTKVQFAMAQNSVDDLSGVGTVPVLIMKWTDGGVDADSFIQVGELSLKGIGSYNFTSADSNFSTATVTNITDGPLSNEPMRLESNSWYWVVVGVPGGTFLGTDGSSNYMPRNFISQKKTPSYKEYSTGLLGAAASDLAGGIDPTDPTSVVMSAFEPGFDFADSIRFAQQKGGLTPAIAWHVTKNKVPVSVPSVTKSDISLNVYPNPATEYINVDVKLTTPASRVTFSIVDGMGRLISRDVKVNVQKGTYQLNTSNLAPGNYYLITSYDNKNVAHSFTVVKR